MVIACDFDSVIHDNLHPVEGRKMGPPIEGAREAVSRFSRKGYKIIIFSVWGGIGGREVIAEWLNYYKIHFDDITNIKPKADCYIDDKAIRFTNWEEIPAEVKRLTIKKLK